MAHSFKQIAALFPELDSDRLDRLSLFMDLLLDWNTKINLISRRDTEHFEIHHLLSALAIYRGIALPDGTRVLDIGTGGGLPGIPLAICFPNCRFHLVDSIGKKIKVVKDLIQQLGLENVTAEQVRAETLNTSYDLITGRAVTALEPFIELARKALTPGRIDTLARGIVYLKGEEIKEELVRLDLQAEQVTPLRQWYTDPFFDGKYLVHLSTDEVRRKNL